jgi:hypothetical protein
MKECSVCKTTENYYAKGMCRACYRKRFLETHAEHLSAYNKKYLADYHAANKTRLNALSRKYYVENRDSIRTKQDAYNATHIATIAKAHAQYHIDNRDKMIAKARTWKIENREKSITWSRVYMRRRRAIDPMFKLVGNLRTRTSAFFRLDGKSRRTMELLGCSKEALVQHLVFQFQPGMTIQNYGKWHIDHIIPLVSAKTKEEAEALCHYTNLQPLWALDNLRKGDRV